MKIILNNLTPLSLIAFSLVFTGCSGGGGGSTPANTTPIIYDVTNALNYVGVVASAVPQTITVTGINFTADMKLSIGETANITPTFFNSQPQRLVASTTISTVPPNNYITVTVNSSSGTPLATAGLGVASAPITLAQVQIIFGSTGAKCTDCHRPSGSGRLDLTSTDAATAALFIQSPNLGCTSRYRVIPGDARRSSSLLIDKIQVSPPSPLCTGTLMPPSGYTITEQQIKDITDWVAGGAHR